MHGPEVEGALGALNGIIYAGMDLIMQRAADKSGGAYQLETDDVVPVIWDVGFQQDDVTDPGGEATFTINIPEGGGSRTITIPSHTHAFQHSDHRHQEKEEPEGPDDLGSIGALQSAMATIASCLSVSTTMYNNGVGSPFSEISKLDDLLGNLVGGLNFIGEKHGLTEQLICCTMAAIDAKHSLLMYNDEIQLGFEYLKGMMLEFGQQTVTYKNLSRVQDVVGQELELGTLAGAYQRQGPGMLQSNEDPNGSVHSI